MALLTSQSEFARQIMRALNLPTNTVAFILRMRVGEIATLDVETYAQQDGVEELATVLTRYKLEEMKEPNVGGEARLAAHQPPQTTTATPQGVASTDQLGRASEARN